jgi:hypothetical protein
MGCINSKASDETSLNAAGSSGSKPARHNAKEDLIELQLSGKRDKRANVIAAANLDDDIEIPSFPKSEEYKEIIRDCVQSTDAFFFTGIRETEVSIIVEAMSVVNVNSGQTVITKGDVGDCFYIIASGTFNASIDGKSVKKYGPKQVCDMFYFVELCGSSSRHSHDHRLTFPFSRSRIPIVLW